MSKGSTGREFACYVVGNRRTSSATTMDKVPTGPTTLGVELKVLSPDRFRMWPTPALQAFLLLRGKSTEGSQEELVTRSFTTWEEKTDIDPVQEHIIRADLEDYKKKLIVLDDYPVPDPFTLKTRWIHENKMERCPAVYFDGVMDFLKKYTPSELCEKIVHAYSMGDVFSYIGNVTPMYHREISKMSAAVFVSAKFKGSKKGSNPYQAWVCLEESNYYNPGGRIFSAYCTCPAGLYGACHHVIRILFRVESYTRLDHENPNYVHSESERNMTPDFAARLGMPIAYSFARNRQYKKHYKSDEMEICPDE